MEGLPQPRDDRGRNFIEQELAYRQAVGKIEFGGAWKPLPDGLNAETELKWIEHHCNVIKMFHNHGHCTNQLVNMLLSLFWRAVRFQGYPGTTVIMFIDTIWQVYHVIMICQRYNKNPLWAYLLRKPSRYIAQNAPRFLKEVQEYENRLHKPEEPIIIDLE